MRKNDFTVIVDLICIFKFGKKIFLDYINAFYEIFDHQNMGLDVISIHVFLSLNDILQEHFFHIMAD